jgi:hypothetical protein
MSKPKKLSRQREWQKKQAVLGNCEICGQPVRLYRRRCDEHGAKAREAKRLREGTSARSSTLEEDREPSRTRKEMRSTRAMYFYLKSSDINSLHSIMDSENLRKSAAVSAALRWYVRSIKR